jgi:mRNA interferase HicA
LEYFGYGNQFRSFPYRRFDMCTLLYEHESVNGNEFLRKIKKLARRRGLTVVFLPDRGNGSHGRVYFGDRFTILKDLKKEIGAGLFGSMLSDLGIRKEEL